jgi:hypothetical protein
VRDRGAPLNKTLDVMTVCLTSVLPWFIAAAGAVATVAMTRRVDLKMGGQLIGGALVLLLLSIFIAVSSGHSLGELACIFTLRDPLEFVPIKGAVWAEYGLLIGGYVVTVVAFLRARSE